MPNSYDDIRMKFKNRINSQLGTSEPGSTRSAPPERAEEVEKIISSDYRQFKSELMPARMGVYETICATSEKLLKVKIPEPKRVMLEKSIDQAHLNITADGAWSASFVVPLLTTILLLIVTQMGFFLFKGTVSMFFVMFSLVLGLSIMVPLQSLPEFLAQNWRLKASNQMVLCVFYIVTYMRHTSNLEHAIEFAADHLNPPLSIDLKKVLWDTEMGRYESIKVSLDAYLEQWKEYNFEFVEALHLVSSSLFEGDETRRIALLDKSLDVILDETYEKMLHYAQNLKSPITMLHMMGVIMPILGMVLLPLVVTFMDGVGWYHLSALYNVLLPIMVYYMGAKILASRPTGYGDSDIAKLMKEQELKQKQVFVKVGDDQINIGPMLNPFGMFVVFLIITFFPLILHFTMGDDWDLVYTTDGDFVTYQTESTKLALLEYRQPVTTATSSGGDGLRGPYGLGATLFSIALPLGLAMSMAFYFTSLSGNLMEVRAKTKKLETEFSSALFQLGNRIGDGIPAEIAFSKVAEVMQGSDSGRFFQYVTHNLSQLGLGLEDAIFNEKVGALVHYPSTMIRSSMKVLIQSARKGPQVASLALLNISRYVKEIHRVDERLKDLMAEVVASINSQINFLSPMIAGIVIGITSMISAIIGKLIRAISCLQAGGGGGASGILSLMNDGVAPYYFQWVVGLYVVQLTYILTILMNGIQNGNDTLAEKDLLAKNLKKATMKYCMISLVVIFLFNLIAANIVGGALSNC